jgi:hypothetical protein
MYLSRAVEMEEMAAGRPCTAVWLMSRVPEGGGPDEAEAGLTAMQYRGGRQADK